jgi:hypothetical protein
LRAPVRRHRRAKGGSPMVRRSGRRAQRNGLTLRLIRPSRGQPTLAWSARCRMVGEMQIGPTTLGLHRRFSPVQHAVTWTKC